MTQLGSKCRQLWKTQNSCNAVNWRRIQCQETSEPSVSTAGNERNTWLQFFLRTIKELFIRKKFTISLDHSHQSVTSLIHISKKTMYITFLLGRWRWLMSSRSLNPNCSTCCYSYTLWSHSDNQPWHPCVTQCTNEVIRISKWKCKLSVITTISHFFFCSAHVICLLRSHTSSTDWCKWGYFLCDEMLH